MVVLRFRDSSEHEDLLKKVKKMKKFTQELEDCLEEAMEEDYGYRGGYRKEYDEEEDAHMRGGRYRFRGGMR